MFQSQQHNGRRWLRPRQLCDYAYSVKISDSEPSPAFLRFLEHERLLLPAARLILPDAVVRVLWQKEHDYLSFQPVAASPRDDDLAAANQYFLDLHRWSSPVADPDDRHPLERTEAPYARFVSYPLTSNTPIQTIAGRVHVADTENGPIYDYDLNDVSVYRGWQIMWLAASLELKHTIVADLTDNAVNRAIVVDGGASLPRARLHRSTSYRGIHWLRDLASTRPALESAARFAERRGRHLLCILRERGNPGGLIDGDDLVAFRDTEVRIAEEAFAEFELTVEGSISAIRLLAAFWSDVTRLGRDPLGADVRDYIGALVMLHRIATGSSFASVSAAVGRATSHFKPTLEVLFGDPLDERAELLEAVLKRDCIPATIGMDSINACVSEADCTEFVSWLRERGLTSFLWTVVPSSEVDDFSHEIREDHVRRALRDLASATEHLIDEILVSLPRTDGENEPSDRSAMATKLKAVVRGTRLQGPFDTAVKQLKAFESSLRVSSLATALIWFDGQDTDIPEDRLALLLNAALRIRNGMLHNLQAALSWRNSLAATQVLRTAAIALWRFTKSRRVERVPDAE